MTATRRRRWPPTWTDGLRRLKLATMRHLAPEVLRHREDPTVDPRRVPAHPRRGRDHRPRRVQRPHPAQAAAFPVTKTLDEFDVTASSVPQPPSTTSPPWNGSAPQRTSAWSDPPAPARATCSSRSASPPSTPGTASATSPPPNSSRPSTAAWPTTPSAGSSTPCCATTWSSVDELGFAPLDDTGAQLLFRFVAAAYERRSLGIASHWPFESWGRFLPEHTTAVSLLDRLLHHATVVVTDGESYRMRRSPNPTRRNPTQDQLINHEEWGLSVGHQRGPQLGR